MAEEALRTRIQASEELLEKAHKDLVTLRGALAVLSDDMAMGAVRPDLAREELNRTTERINRTVAFINATRESIAIMKGQLQELLEAPEPPEIPEEPLDGDLDGDIVPPKPAPAAVPGGEADQLKHIGGLFGQFGRLGALKDDATVGSGIAGAVGSFFTGLGLTPETLQDLKKSPLDRELTAKWATGISTAAQTGLGLLYSIGVITEVASLGQIDTLIDAIDNIITNLGIDDIIKPLFTAPYYAALTIPTRQYWMSVFKPTVPPIQDLRLMAVREAFPVETRKAQFAEMEKWGGYHGLDEYWTERYLRAGYERMDVRTALDMFYWRLWDEDQLKAFLSIADIHPDDHDAIISTLWRSPTRYERRHGYIMGVYGDEDLEEYFHRDGLSDEDSKTATAAMTAYALNAERNAVARAAGVVYRETLEGVLVRIRKLDTAVVDTMEALEEAKADLKAGAAGVTQATVDKAEENIEHARSALGSLKRRAAGIRTTAEAELRTELAILKITGDRQDLWVRRYAMEARITTRPWELIEEAVPEVPYEPEG